MPRLKTRPPKLSKSGNYAYVYLNGDRFPMGRWGSEESEKNYRRFIAEWASVDALAAVRPGRRINVERLVYSFLSWAEKYIDHRDFGHCKVVSEAIVHLYAGTPADEFGPKALAAVQKHLELSGRFSRGYCNKLVCMARRMFRWGVGEELIHESTAAALKYVQPLREGWSTAPETAPREDVPDTVVERTLPFLLPTVAAMVMVQRLAAMRPNEVCRMQVGDLDMSGDIWIYRPGKHKGKWRGHKKAVALGKPEQKLISPYLVDKEPDQAVFSPRDAMRERKERDAARRKTPVQPSQRERAEKRAANPKERVGDFYTSESYFRSIVRSIEIANRTLEEKIPHWTPYQLRHAAVTEITYENQGNPDVARAVAGQKSIKVTLGYNHADLQIAIDQAKKRGKKKVSSKKRSAKSKDA